MNRSTLIALSSLVFSFSLAGCIGTETDMAEEDGETAEVSEALCIAPPSADQTGVQSNSSDVGSSTERSSPDNTYYASKGDYVVEITNVKNSFASSQLAFAYSTKAGNSKSVCEHTTTTATLFGFDDAQGCWAQIGSTKSKLGVYVPASGLAPAYCDDGVSFSIPSTVSRVRVKGHSVLQTVFGPAGQQITEGASWQH
jgi:hypothetical protein